jgi:CheY-like chemotaxis protein
VDDDPEMRAPLLDVLRNEGYDVAEAMDEAQTVLAPRAREYEVILFKPFRMEGLRAAIRKALDPNPASRP